MIANRQSGSELFRELTRLFPGALVEEYYKHGTWDVECMLLDLELIERHREEAGAPEPPPLETIPQVQLPEAANPPWRESLQRLPHPPRPKEVLRRATKPSWSEPSSHRIPSPPKPRTVSSKAANPIWHVPTPPRAPPPNWYTRETHTSSRKAAVAMDACGVTANRGTKRKLEDSYVRHSNEKQVPSVHGAAPLMQPSSKSRASVSSHDMRGIVRVSSSSAKDIQPRRVASSPVGSDRNSVSAKLPSKRAVSEASAPGDLIRLLLA